VQVFAGQTPESYASHTRSLRLAGHATSIRLEACFWLILDEIAASQDLSTPRFLSMLYDEALNLHGEVANFTSLLRVSCLKYMESQAKAARAARAELAAQAAE